MVCGAIEGIKLGNPHRAFNRVLAYVRHSLMLAPETDRSRNKHFEDSNSEAVPSTADCHNKARRRLCVFHTYFT